MKLVNKNKTICILLIILCFALLSCKNTVSGKTANFNENTVIDSKRDYGIFAGEIGSRITFGKYYKYDDDILEPLEWIIVNKDPDKQTALLITKDIIDFEKFYDDDWFIESKEYMSWEKSTIRTWLNQTFYDIAFSNGEKAAIAKSKNYYNYIDRTDKRFGDGTKREGFTDDKVFLLGFEETEYYFNSTVQGLRCNPTLHALRNLEKKNEYPVRELQDDNLDLNNIYTTWWLRTSQRAYCADFAGNQPTLGIYNDYGGVRPCINVYYREDTDKLENKNIGDIVLFGNIEPYSYIISEKNRWIVLDKQDNKLLLLSQFGLGDIPYNDSKEDITWKDSTIRNWLNDNYYNKWFNQNEKELISETIVLNYGNKFTGISAGQDTKDKVFLLSYEELERYKENSYTVMNYTPQIVDRKFRYNYISGADWYLRTPGEEKSKVLVVRTGAKSIDMVGRDVNSDNVCIRPAIWVSTESVKENSDQINTLVTANSENTLVNVESKDDDYVIVDLDKKDEYETIEFGKYYINSDEVLKPIEWIVLDEDKLTGNKLLLSKYVLDVGKFDDDDNVGWEKSYIRRWLNDEFYNKCFSEKEKLNIVEVENDNQVLSLYMNYSGKNIGETKDKVFLLSQDEATKYFSKEYPRSAIPTKVCANRGMSMSTSNAYYGNISWYLRTKDDKTFYVSAAGTIMSDGSVTSKGRLKYSSDIFVGYDEIGIRPAIWYKDGSSIATSSNVINTEYSVGDIVKFGKYYNDSADVMSEIEWVVIDIDEDENLTLWSNDALDVKIYDSDGNIWEKSDLRTWLNSEFYNNAFNADEKRRIVETKVTRENNIRNGVYDGNDTTDKVYILSERVALANDSYRNCKATNYAKNEYKKSGKNLKTYSIIDEWTNDCAYWFRNPGTYGQTNSIAWYREEGGFINQESSKLCFVRPVIKVNLQNQ